MSLWSVFGGDVSPLASFFKPANPGEAGREQSDSGVAAGSALRAAGGARVHSLACGGRPGAAVAERLQADGAGDAALQRQTGQHEQVGNLLSLQGRVQFVSDSLSR